MMYEVFIKVSKDLPNDHISKLIAFKIKLAKQEQFSKSVRLMNGVVEMYDSSGDDFIRNLFTARILFNAYKIPRIIKHYLLK